MPLRDDRTSSAAGNQPTALIHPRDVVELAVRRIWREQLNQKDIAMNDDFFDIGGSSLLAIHVLAELNNEFGVQLPIEAILSGYTIERMARLIREGYQRSPSSLVSIRPGERLPALACIHPVGGSVIWFHELADALPKGIPCVGLQALALDPRCEPHRDLPSMAAHYLAELANDYDPGDTVVTGYSFGGLVGFEMACQMETAGTPLRGVLLLDTIVPNEPYRRPPLAVLLRVLVKHALQLDLDLDQLAALPPGQAREQILTAATKTGALPAGYGYDRLQRMIDILSINHEAAGRYQLPVYHRLVHLVRPEGVKSKGDSTEIWRAHCPGGLEVHDVAGPHIDLISGRHAAAVGELFRRLWLGA